MELSLQWLKYTTVLLKKHYGMYWLNANVIHTNNSYKASPNNQMIPQTSLLGNTMSLDGLTAAGSIFKHTWDEISICCVIMCIHILTADAVGMDFLTCGIV